MSAAYALYIGISFQTIFLAIALTAITFSLPLALFYTVHRRSI